MVFSSGLDEVDAVNKRFIRRGRIENLVVVVIVATALERVYIHRVMY